MLVYKFSADLENKVERRALFPRKNKSKSTSWREVLDMSALFFSAIFFQPTQRRHRLPVSFHRLTQSAPAAAANKYGSLRVPPVMSGASSTATTFDTRSR